MFYLRLKSGLSGRGQIWTYSLLMIEKSPWLGVGFLNMGEEFYKQFGPAYIIDMMLFFDRIKYTPNKATIDFFNFHAHNLFLNLAVEMGIFAALAALIFYIIIICRIFFFLRREKLQRWECEHILLQCYMVRTNIRLDSWAYLLDMNLVHLSQE